MREYATYHNILLLIAIVLFILAAFSVSLPLVSIVPLGLFFFAASFLV